MTSVPPEPSIIGLARNNPFSALSGGGVGGGQTTASGQEDVGITLIRIVPWRNGTFAATVQTKTNQKMTVAEGQSFEEFRVIAIDEKAKTLKLHSSSLNRTITLTEPSP